MEYKVKNDSKSRMEGEILDYKKEQETILKETEEE